MIRKLTKDEVTFSLRIEDEDLELEGAFASGDDDADIADIADIRDRLERGDLWAWCCVFVTATWGNHSFSTNLGGCSYATALRPV
jgi:hypothetical protein